MAGFLSSRALGLVAALAGFGVMNVAMFLHPMSPEDFLALVLSDPMQTLVDSQGGLMAAFFWAGLFLSLLGSVNLSAHVIRAGRNILAQNHLRHALPH